MNMSEAEIEEVSRKRARSGLLVVVGFLVVLAGIAGNDFLVHVGKAASPQRSATLVLIGGGAALLIGSLSNLIVITRRSLRDPTLRRKLWDELASSNQLHSMMFAYLAMLFVLIVLAAISMFTTLPSPWVVNGVLFTGLCTQAVSFALLERRGDDA